MIDQWARLRPISSKARVKARAGRVRGKENQANSAPKPPTTVIFLPPEGVECVFRVEDVSN